LAKSAGAFAVVCGTTQDAERLEMARRLGADRIVNVDGEDAAYFIQRLTGSQGADVTIECSGAPAAARLGLEATRRGGQYTQVGLFSGPFMLSFDQIAYKELRVTGSLGQRWSSWERGLALLSRGKVDTRSLVSHILPMTEWQEAFRLFDERTALKIVLVPVD